METKKIIILAAVAIVIIIGGMAAYRYSDIYSGSQINGGNLIENVAGQPVESLTRAEAPKNVKIPEAGEEAAEGVAVPVSVTQAAPGVSAKFRLFTILAENDLFDPSTVIVKIGDTVHINFTAVDKTYDITFPDYGMKQTATKGQTKILEFQAVSDGKFTYYCSSCGGINSKTIGYIIVAP